MHSIQAQYGWTDEQCLDLRIGRLVQMINVINAAEDIRRMELEWQSKLIASVVANTIEDGKARGKLLKKIQAMNLRGVDESDDQSPAAGPADTSGDGRDLEDIIENGSVAQALAKNMRRKGPGLDQAFRPG